MIIWIERCVLVVGCAYVKEYHSVAVLFRKGFEYVGFTGGVVDGERLLAVGHCNDNNNLGYAV